MSPKSMLVIGTNILSGNRTGGMYYTFKIFEHFRRLQATSVEPMELSEHRRLIRLRLMSLYLIAFRRRRYDYIVVDASAAFYAYFVLAKLRGARIVCLFYHFVSREQNGARRLIWRIKERLLLRIADRKVFISRSTLKDARQLGYSGDDHVRAVPGIDKELWIDRTAGYDPTRSDFAVICVTHVVRRKGVMDLVAAFSAFLRGIEDEARRRAVTLNIVGDDRLDPEFTAELNAFIRGNGVERNATLWGRRPLRELMGHYRAASVFVHPSHYEGFGIVVVEAASFGLPIIVSDGGSLPELVDHGRYAAVYPAGDRAALRGELEFAYRDVERRFAMSAQAAELYRRSPTWQDTGRLIEGYLARTDVGALQSETIQ